MKKTFRTAVMMFGLLASGTIFAAGLQNLAAYANPLVGSDSSGNFSHGNTYPATALPFGMTDYTPMSGSNMTDSWIYTWDATSLAGIKATHEPSPWIGDYGDFAIMPIAGDTQYSFGARKAAYTKENQTSKPYYYNV